MISESEYNAAIAQRAAADAVISQFHGEKIEAFTARWEAYKRGESSFADEELIYSAETRCEQCGAGLAHPKDCGAFHRWDCSEALTGRGPKDHASFSFTFWSVKVEDRAEGKTTRPSTLGKSNAVEIR